MPSARLLTALLRRPGYLGFAATVFLSRMSSSMFVTGAVLFVLARTGSAALAGITAAASVLPMALSGPLLGAWLDVAPRRRVLIVADQLSSVGALGALLLLAGQAPDWVLPALAVAYSVTRPLSSGSFYSTLAELVGPDLLDTASVVESVNLNLSFVVGPAFAGILAGAFGAASAIGVQAALTLACALLIAVNRAFELRPAQRAASTRDALAAGTRALRDQPALRAPALGSTPAAFGWGLMSVGFPLYAARVLHAGAHASGYLWAAVAGGSIVGTVVLAGHPSRGRIAGSYAALGVSALAWPLAHTLALGVGLIGLTGFLEGPAYSDTISLRQRHAPPEVRAQVMTTLIGLNLIASSLGSALAGALAAPGLSILAFTAANGLAALLTWRA